MDDWLVSLCMGVVWLKVVADISISIAKEHHVKDSLAWAFNGASKRLA